MSNSKWHEVSSKDVCAVINVACDQGFLQGHLELLNRVAKASVRKNKRVSLEKGAHNDSK